MFLRDGFGWWALLLPWVWLLRFRLWFWAAGAFLLDLLIKIAAGETTAALGLSLLLGALVALEGPSLRAARLLRKGWREAGAVWAQGERDAEVLYFAGEAEPAEVSAPLDTPQHTTATNVSPLRPGRTLFDLRGA